MEMHQVRYFLAVVRELNFTRAADECDVTQPSLTRAIQKLEEELGGPLFRRERSRTHLTDLGRLMLPHLERTYEAAEAAKHLARGVGRAEVAPLALGVQSAIASDTLNLILKELAQGLPGFELTLTAGTGDDLMERAMNGGLDLLITERLDDPPERVDHWPLYEHAYAVMTRADHPFALGDHPSLSSLREEHWIDHEGDGCARLRAAGAGMAFEPLVRHRVNDMQQIRQMVASGLGSAFVPAPRSADGLAVVFAQDAHVTREVVLGAVAGRRRGLAAEAFIRASRARDWSEAVG
ncbi:LysR family transcriptional regulator [Brevundimonas sp.]|uniref:LysR family transcriptional regulator n=1 Tax=Brevundimonas sp. TaxID=1871086 RepID=UPI003566F9AC